MVVNAMCNFYLIGTKDDVKLRLAEVIIKCNIFIDKYFDFKAKEIIYENLLGYDVISIRSAIIYAENRVDSSISLNESYKDITDILSAAEMFRETKKIFSTNDLNMKDDYIRICDDLKKCISVMCNYLGMKPNKK